MINRKEQILEAASDLLTTRSYSSFSYQDLSDRLGIRKAGKLPVPVPQRGFVLGQGGVPRRKLHPQILVLAGQQDVRLLKV